MNHSIKKFSDKLSLASDIQSLLNEFEIDAMSMKMYSNDEDIDTVVINPSEYLNAMDVLRKNGWYKKNNKSKIRERDKDFFIHNNQKYKIHLHKYFSWNTVQYLNSKIIWKRKRKENKILLPSYEDEILIIAAHSLFENMCIVPDELLYARKIMKSNNYGEYMLNHVNRFGWEHGLGIILHKLRTNEPHISFEDLMAVRIKKIFKTNPNQIINELIAYFCIDWLWCYPKRFNKLDENS